MFIFLSVSLMLTVVNEFINGSIIPKYITVYRLSQCQLCYRAQWLVENLPLVILRISHKAVEDKMCICEWLQKLCKQRHAELSQSHTMCVEDLSFAKEVTVSCIHSSQYNAASVSHDMLLRRHFSSPRFCAVLLFHHLPQNCGTVLL